MKSILNTIRTICFSRESRSIAVSDPRIFQHLLEDPEFPFLVSFPRTGSHWLRMLMELYFERPTLIRSFYFHRSRNYLVYHTHDLDLDVNRKNVLYLYRHPVPTVYSQLRYHQADTADIHAIQHWAALYGKHLVKWLVHERTGERKTVIKYERLQTDLVAEFTKITTHFDQALDIERLQRAATTVTKDEIRFKTSHDPQVIASAPAYNEDRERFAQQHGNLVLDLVLRQDARLAPLFDVERA